MVYHLGNYFILFRCLSKYPGFIDIVGQWFLKVKVFFQLHGAESDNSMIVVRNSYGNSIKVFALFIKHFTPVVIKRGFRKLFDPGRCLSAINIAQKGYFSIFFRCNCIMPDVIGSLPPAAYCGNKQFVAGIDMSQPAYCEIRKNSKSGCPGGSRFYKIPP